MTAMPNRRWWSEYIWAFTCILKLSFYILFNVEDPECITITQIIVGKEVQDSMDVLFYIQKAGNHMGTVGHHAASWHIDNIVMK